MPLHVIDLRTAANDLPQGKGEKLITDKDGDTEGRGTQKTRLTEERSTVGVAIWLRASDPVASVAFIEHDQSVIDAKDFLFGSSPADGSSFQLAK